MKKKVIAILVSAVLILGLVFQDNLIRGYVLLRHEKLESYAAQVLKAGKTDNYGIWETDVIHEDGVVEFRTGGWGLAPSSTYKGFYYSADNTHRVYSIADGNKAALEIDGDTAVWTDGTDNHGSSIRITDNWFWYEASF